MGSAALSNQKLLEGEARNWLSPLQKIKQYKETQEMQHEGEAAMARYSV